MLTPCLHQAVWLYEPMVNVLMWKRGDSSAYAGVLHIDGLMQDCSNSSALALELLDSCTKPPISFALINLSKYNLVLETYLLTGPIWLWSSALRTGLDTVLLAGYTQLIGPGRFEWNFI